MKRRAFIICLVALVAGLNPAGVTGSQAAEAGSPKRKILFFSKSSGFEHSCIRVTDGQPSHVDKVLTELGPKHNLEFTCTKDGSLFTPQNIARYDAFLFYTTGDLTTPGKDGNPPMPPGGKAALLEAIHKGKGFIGTHTATDTFHSRGSEVDPYIAMVGGEFVTHGKQQKAKMSCADPKFPGCGGLNGGFELFEEWYALKNIAADLRVLLVQETAGMDGWMYQRPPYPATWARKHGKGRVFYTSMGHREDVWTNPVFQQILIGGINWAVGNMEADVTPNVDKVTPGCNQLPSSPPKPSEPSKKK